MKKRGSKSKGRGKRPKVRCEPFSYRRLVIALEKNKRKAVKK